MTFALPKLPTSELVGAAWLGSVPGLTPGMVATTLPGGDSTWAKTGFVTIVTIGGSPGIYLPVKNPVFQVDCFAVKPGSNQTPWSKANGLAEVIRYACLQRTSMRQPLDLAVRGVPHGSAVVQSAYLLTEPQRRYADAAEYALYSFDLAMSWVICGRRFHHLTSTKEARRGQGKRPAQDPPRGRTDRDRRQRDPGPRGGRLPRPGRPAQGRHCRQGDPGGHQHRAGRVRVRGQDRHQRSMTVARLTLTPTPLVPNTPEDLTSLVAALDSDTGVVFSDTGREFLVVVVATASSTYSINIGEEVDGSQPPALTGTLAVGTWVFPPFGPEIEQAGANAGQVWVDFGTPANVSAAIVQH